MKKLLLALGVVTSLISCTKDEFELDTPPSNYQFEMSGRTTQDINGYYHVIVDTTSTQQTLHRFSAYITNTDIYGLPSQVIWSCETYWEFDNHTVPIINSTSFSDPNVDSIFCMMAPIGSMVGDTVIIYGKALFEEGNITLEDNIKVIFN